MPITERAHRPGVCGRVLTAGIAFFGMVLVVSAIAKFAAPHPAARSLGWTGLALGPREVLVALGSLAEGVVGMSLVLLPGIQVVRWAGAGVALVLLLLHSLGSGDHCGCFGEADVPDWITLGLLGCGLVSTTLAGGRVRASSGRSRLVLLACAITAMPVSWVLLRPQASGVDPSGLLAAELLLREASQGCQVVVGSKGCEHCESALRELAHADQGGQLWLVTREGDAGTWERPLGIEVRTLTIADDLWWELVSDRLPSIWRLDGHGLVGVNPTTGSR